MTQILIWSRCVVEGQECLLLLSHPLQENNIWSSNIVQGYSSSSSSSSGSSNGGDKGDISSSG